MSGVAVGAVGLGLGLVGGIGKLFSSGSANKSLGQLASQIPTYTANPIAAQRMALAQNLLNARAPGAAYAQANIYGNEANQTGNIERNATSGSQALAMGAVNEANTNKGFNDLSAQEAQDYQRRYGNLVNAQQGEISEGDKVYQSQLNKFGDLAQIRGMQNQNTQNAWQSISNLGFGAANFGLAGGAAKIFGGGMGSQGQAGGASQPYATYSPGMAAIDPGYGSPANGMPYISPGSSYQYMNPNNYYNPNQ